MLDIQHLQSRRAFYKYSEFGQYSVQQVPNMLPWLGTTELKPWFLRNQAAQSDSCGLGLRGHLFLLIEKAADLHLQHKMPELNASYGAGSD